MKPENKAAYWITVQDWTNDRVDRWKREGFAASLMGDLWFDSQKWEPRAE